MVSTKGWCRCSQHVLLSVFTVSREHVKNVVAQTRSNTRVHLSIYDCQSEHQVTNLMLIRTRKSPNILDERKLPTFVVANPRSSKTMDIFSPFKKKIHPLTSSVKMKLLFTFFEHFLRQAEACLLSVALIENLWLKVLHFSFVTVRTCAVRCIQSPRTKQSLIAKCLLCLCLVHHTVYLQIDLALLALLSSL